MANIDHDRVYWYDRRSQLNSRKYGFIAYTPTHETDSRVQGLSLEILPIVTVIVATG
jgi:hypothetical protein